jgi:N6-L-threonylcarbamoyladenine synthase
MISNGCSDQEVSAFTFEFVAKTLFKIAENIRSEYGNLPIVWAGGVMSNSIIKKRLSELENVYFTEPQYSADNAVGVALICRNKHLSETRE